MALLALSRTGKGGDLAARVERLESDLARVRALLARVAPAGEAPPEVGADAQARAGTATGEDVVPTLQPEIEPQPARPIPPGQAPRVSVSPLPPTPPASGPRPWLPPPAPSPLSQVDWERWLGVRGAAVLGGAALALAGLFFFRYSIEQGLIPPWLRVVLGVLTGIAAIAGAE